MTVRTHLAAAAFAVLTTIAGASAATAAQCGNSAAGFDTWKQQFASEARAKGVGSAGVAALMETNYNHATIAADRGMKSFKLSPDQFLANTGGPAMAPRGRKLKQSQAALFASIEQRYGVP